MSRCICIIAKRMLSILSMRGSETLFCMTGGCIDGASAEEAVGELAAEEVGDVDVDELPSSAERW